VLSIVPSDVAVVVVSRLVLVMLLNDSWVGDDVSTISPELGWDNDKDNDSDVVVMVVRRCCSKMGGSFNFSQIRRNHRRRSSIVAITIG
jgi:hypothetical protein